MVRSTVHQTFLTETDVPARRAKWTMTDLQDYYTPRDGRHGVKRHAYRPGTLCEACCGMGTTRFCPSLRVATCDYVRRSDGWEPFSGQLGAHRRPKSQTTAYFKSLRTMKRRKIAPTTYNAALPAWRQAVFRWLRAVVLDALSDCHLARASPER